MASSKVSEEDYTKPQSPQTEFHQLIVSLHDIPGGVEILNDFINSRRQEEKYFNINESDNIGLAAIHWAVLTENLDFVKLLVRRGANIHAKDKLGFTPLFHATGRYPNYEIAKFLIEAGARVMETNESNATPLHGAALQSNKELVKLLLEHNADPQANSDDGTTPFDLATDHEVKGMLHKKYRQEEKMTEKRLGQSCGACGVADVPLKRCSQCQVTLYCSRECQKKDWKNHKKQCDEGIYAHPPRSMYCPSDLFTLFGNRLDAISPNINVKSRTVAETISSAKTAPVGKRFVVKVQRPLGGSLDAPEDMMVYNVDRSIVALVYPETAGYNKLKQKIIQQGVLGAKGYFWAEKVQQTEENGPLLRVFPGKMAPVPKW